MFSNMTYENILNDMLSRVPSNVDKREGSIIYDAIAPTAFKLSETYFNLSTFIDLFFVDTSTGEYLDKLCKAFGVDRKKPTKAVRKIITNGIIPIESRFSISDISYVVISKLSDTEYFVECEDFGSIGNLYSGPLTSLNNLNVEAELSEIVDSGENIETDESLRERYYLKVRNPATSGNIYDYLNWALKVEGVGKAKVFPLWNGPGTVKVIIIDTDMKIDTTLESRVYDYIETVRPIGAEVTVNSPIAHTIDISASVELDNSKTLGVVIESFTLNLNEYLYSLTFKNDVISYAKIGSILLSTPGIKDYNNLLVNASDVNIVLTEEEIPILNDINISEV